jgi:MoxR-like ATPase
MQPTPRQTSGIWKFCVKHGNSGHDVEQWVKMGKTGILEKKKASDLIGRWFSFIQAPTPAGKHEIETLMSQFVPGFKVVKEPFPDGPEKQAEGKPEKPEEQGGEGQEDKGPVEPQPGETDKVKQMLQELEKELEKKVKPKPGDGIPKDFKVSEDYIPPPEFGTILALTKLGVNVLLTGPAGAGKSRLAREIAVALGTECHDPVTLGGSMRYPQVFGSTKLTVKDGIQVSEFEPAPLLQQVQKPGVQVIDEVFSAEGDVTNGMNGLLEPSTRAVMTPAGMVKMHPECHLIATANTNGRALSNMYTGVTVQDFSLLDRFVEVKINYNLDVEKKLLMRLEDPTVEEWTFTRLKTLRQKIEENNIQFDASTRKLLTCIKMVVGGLGGEKAFELAFLVQLSKAERAKVGM